MKNNAKFIIYIFILTLFAAVIWIKYDYDRAEKVMNQQTAVELLSIFIKDNNITSKSFVCPAKNESIIYLDEKHLLTEYGELYNVKYDSLYDNGYNCQLIETEVVEGFYTDTIVYDSEYNFYDISRGFNSYEGELLQYYYDDLNRLNMINDKYPYIYLYDMEGKMLNLDNSLASNKILIDNKGNILMYTNYGYPTSLNLLQSEDVEIIFDRLDYMGVIFAIFRSSNNEELAKEQVKYLNILDDVKDYTYALRIITNKGMYNEVIDSECRKAVCDTKLVMDKEFSKHFNNITYSNGKYIFIKDTPTVIYNIENYVSNK